MPFLNPDDKRGHDSKASRLKSHHSRDIAGGYPEPGDLALRDACDRDLARFCKAYFPNAFPLPWCPDHRKAIGRLEEVLLDGGLFALAMPRGSGKSSLATRAAVWALLYGHRRFVCLIGATQRHADQLLKSIRTELAFNALLARDFRQVCYPIGRLENNAKRCVGQLFNGEQTRIEWGADRVVLPTMPPEACDGPDVSGSCLSAVGLTGALRGQSHTLVDGTVIRPEVVLLDDPQTKESSYSPDQCEKRVSLIKGDVLGMAGPGQSIAAIMPCTVIRKDDMAEEMLDRKKNPEWSGQRTKMVDAFPTNEELWAEYERIRRDDFEAERGVAGCNAFYEANREAMDAGAAVAWPENFEKNEVSALQHAMNLKIRDPAAFYAEYQNDPMPEAEGVGQLTAEEIAHKVNRLPRGHAYLAAGRVTAFIDVHGSLLYWAVCAWEDNFTGYLLDYGTFPDQKRPYFDHAEAKQTLERVVPAAGLEGRIYAGLETLTDALLSREWPRDDGAALTVERCLIDANWGVSTAVVKKFCRQSPHAAVLTPSHGRFIGPDAAPMSQWPKKTGERFGLNWRLRSMEQSSAVRSVTFDANFWKSFLHARLAVAMGDRGSLSLFGEAPEAHRLFADHLTSEYPKETFGHGRVVDAWKLRPGRDNHYLDCLVGCCVAASMQGVQLAETRASAPAARQRLSMAEMKARTAAAADPGAAPARPRLTMAEMRQRGRP